MPTSDMDHFWFLVSKMLLEDPEIALILTCKEDLEVLEGHICSLSKSSWTKCSCLTARLQILV